ncbi:universal stress protein [Methanococcoides sp.]|uniref:universal stress protein n=1 Tax=Methanococcoides sp. TaxID=1966350 RepID=UPI00272E5401|nr:universal stress protein [Methanococcoides sp.]
MDCKEYKTILIATDGSVNAEKAVMSGLKIASSCGASVLALYVMEMDVIGITPEAVHRDYLAAMEVAATEHMTSEQWREFARIADEKWKTERQKHLMEKGERITAYVQDMGKSLNIDVRTIIEEGHPAATILNTAKKENVDMVVIGTLGMTADGTFKLGSVADKVIRNSPVEVLAVR